MTNDAELAERIDAIAYPGLTANFDAGKTAALAVTMIDWKVAGPAYAADDGRDRRPPGRRAGSPGSPGLRRRPGPPVTPVRDPRRTSGAAASTPPKRLRGPTCSPAASASRRGRGRRRERPAHRHPRAGPARHEADGHGELAALIAAALAAEVDPARSRRPRRRRTTASPACTSPPREGRRRTWARTGPQASPGVPSPQAAPRRCPRVGRAGRVVHVSPPALLTSTGSRPSPAGVARSWARSRRPRCGR